MGKTRAELPFTGDHVGLFRAQPGGDLGLRRTMGGGPRLRMFMVLRWIREATNNLLPVAQIGGEVVGARLLSLFGVGMAKAAAPPPST